MDIRSDEPIRMGPGTVILQCPPCSWNKYMFCGYSYLAPLSFILVNNKTKENRE